MNTETATNKNSTDCLRILQITDTHLYADPEDQLLGVNSRQTLQQVLQHVSAADFDLLLATGDLVHDGSVAGYRRFADMMLSLDKPVYCLPGNHDKPHIMQQELNTPPLHYQDAVVVNNWLLVFLDSTVTDSAAGHLADTQLTKLKKLLQQHTGLHVLICMHHNPLPMQSEWLDRMMIDNANEFFEIVDHSNNVRGILWGHVHQEFAETRNNVQMMATPSTCIQFEKYGKDFSLAALAAGFRWLELFADGSINSHVERLADLPADLQMDSAGYK